MRASGFISLIFLSFLLSLVDRIYLKLSPYKDKDWYWIYIVWVPYVGKSRYEFYESKGSSDFNYLLSITFLDLKYGY
jgi:hypothetical protein